VAHRCSRPAPNTSNTPGTCQHQTRPHRAAHSIVNMDPPDMDALQLSDSDSDALFDTPAARKNKNKSAQNAEANAGEGGAAGAKARAKESHYTTEEAREATLRRELESIRNVNKVIEGVVDSLQKAKDNMEVSATILYTQCSADSEPDRFQDCPECLHPSPDLDAHPFPDRAQPAPDPEPPMAGRIPGLGCNRGGRDVPPASSRAPRGRRASEERGSSKEDGGRATQSRSSTQARDQRTGAGNQRARRLCIHLNYWRLCRSWGTIRARSQPQWIHGWTSWQRHRTWIARQRQGIDMRPSLFDISQYHNKWTTD
jgi:hypothetical protein